MFIQQTIPVTPLIYLVNANDSSLPISITIGKYNGSTYYEGSALTGNGSISHVSSANGILLLFALQDPWVRGILNDTLVVYGASLTGTPTGNDGMIPASCTELTVPGFYPAPATQGVFFFGGENGYPKYAFLKTISRYDPLQGFSALITLSSELPGPRANSLASNLVNGTQAVIFGGTIAYAPSANVSTTTTTTIARFAPINMFSGLSSTDSATMAFDLSFHGGDLNGSTTSFNNVVYIFGGRRSNNYSNDPSKPIFEWDANVYSYNGTTYSTVGSMGSWIHAKTASPLKGVVKLFGGYSETSQTKIGTRTALSTISSFNGTTITTDSLSLPGGRAFKGGKTI